MTRAAKLKIDLMAPPPTLLDAVGVDTSAGTGKVALETRAPQTPTHPATPTDAAVPSGFVEQVSTDLINIKALKAAHVFAPGGTEKIIAQVETAVRAIKIDATTPKGRKAAISLAHKVARSKTALDDIGKEFVADLKHAVSNVDADRRFIRDRLDRLRDEVRKPVDDYEDAERTRKNDHLRAIAEVEALTYCDASHEMTLADVDARMLTLVSMQDRDWQEFSADGDVLLSGVSQTLAKMRCDIIKRDADRIELKKLRAQQDVRMEELRLAAAEKERRERDERIAAEAKVESEQKAARDREIIEQQRQRAEREKLAAEENCRKAIATAQKAAEEAAAAIVVATAKAEQDRLDAIEAERKRIKDSLAAEEAVEIAAAAAREADENNRRIVEGVATADIMKYAGLTKHDARQAIKAIAGGHVSGVTIAY